MKVAETGPIFRATLAVISSGETCTSSLQPGMQRASTSGSFSAAQTASRATGIRYAPAMSILVSS